MIFRFEDPRDPRKVFTWYREEAEIHLPNGKVNRLPRNQRPAKFLYQLIVHGNVDQDARPIGSKNLEEVVPSARNDYKKLLNILGVDAEDKTQAELFIKRGRGSFHWRPLPLDRNDAAYEDDGQEPVSDVSSSRYWHHFEFPEQDGTARQAYYLACYPVTNQIFRRFIDCQGYEQSKYWPRDGWTLRLALGWREPAFFKDCRWNKLHQPVVGVSWYEAAAFCQMLNEQNQLPYHFLSRPCIRLPTEREWAWAAAGSHEDQFPWGGSPGASVVELSRKANFGGTRNRTTHVCAYSAGKTNRGLYDMAGNVWEWCAEPSKARTSGLKSAPIKGGSWGTEAETMRANYTDKESPGQRGAQLGFRLCLANRNA